ncbi:unnamed protein product, partial [Timema podura]|nr:unnamed protein product [Timema podura]
MYVGGLPSADAILERPSQVHSDDLVGCVHSVSVNGRALNLSSPVRSRGVDSTCGRGHSPCTLSNEVAELGSSHCGALGSCLDRWNKAACVCSETVVAPNCDEALRSVRLSEGGFVEFRVSEKHRRMHLLEGMYGGSTLWGKREEQDPAAPTSPAKSLSLMFRTMSEDGLILYSATNKDYTSV